jgi:hypothetical protein
MTNKSARLFHVLQIDETEWRWQSNSLSELCERLAVDLDSVTEPVVGTSFIESNSSMIKLLLFALGSERCRSLELLDSIFEDDPTLSYSGLECTLVLEGQMRWALNG